MQEIALTIRHATDADGPAVERLAQLDAKRVPRGEVLVALGGGTPIAALAVEDGHAVADPFSLSSQAVELLRVRAAQQYRESRRSWLRALRRMRVPAPMLR